MSELKKQRLAEMKARVQAALADQKYEGSAQKEEAQEGSIQGEEGGLQKGAQQREEDEEENEENEGEEAEAQGEGDEEGEGDEGDIKGEEIDPRLYSWHFDMLHDKERNEKYQQAIERVVKKVSLKTNHPAALDIGTGSGLLAMFARRAGCEQVIAIEVDPVLAQIAQENIAANKLSNIKVKCGHSSKLKLDKQDRKADIFVSELLDNGLLGEDFLPTLRDAQQRFLSKNAVILPSSAQVYAQLVSSPTLHAWQHLDPNVLGCKLPEDIQNDPGPASPLAVHISPLIQAGLATYLSDPFPVFSFDFRDPPSQDGRCKRMNVNITRSGCVHAIVFWWECVLVDEISLTNGPDFDTKREHWSQAVYIVHTPVKVEEKDSVRVLAAHNDVDIWFPLLHVQDEEDKKKHLIKQVSGSSGEKQGELDEDQELEETEGAPPMHESESGLHDTYDPDRFWSLSDAHRVKLYREVFRKIAARNKTGLVLSVEDGPLLAVLAGQEGLSVKSLQSSQDNFLLTSAFLKANGLNKVAVARNMKALLGAKPSKDVSAVCALPYFQGMDGSWSGDLCMMFCSKLQELKPVLSTGTLVIPARARLMGALVECPSLFARKQPIDRVCELDLSNFNKLYEKNVIVSEQMWRHQHKLLSLPFKLLELELLRLRSHALSLSVDINCAGSLHALVVWVDYVVDSDDPTTVWSTSDISTASSESKKRKRNTSQTDSSHFIPSCWYQGARILHQEKKVSVGTRIKISAKFDPQACYLDAKVA